MNTQAGSDDRPQTGSDEGSLYEPPRIEVLGSLDQLTLGIDAGQDDGGGLGTDFGSVR